MESLAITYKFLQAKYFYRLNALPVIQSAYQQHQNTE